jgi:hypothetical protein
MCDIKVFKKLFQAYLNYYMEILRKCKREDPICANVFYDEYVEPALIQILRIHNITDYSISFHKLNYYNNMGFWMITISFADVVIASGYNIKENLLST